MVYRQTEKTRNRNEQRKHDIMSAARSLFAEQGYNSTTMNHIVKRADTSIGNAYFYFENKEELLRDIVMDVIADFWKDDIIGSTQVVTMKLALVLYHCMREMIVNDEVAHLLLIGNSIPTIRKAMFQNFTARVGDLFDSAPELLQGTNTDLAIDSTYGSEMWILERKRSGEIKTDVHEICLFHVKWTLQALNIPPAQIQKTLLDLVRHTSVRDISS